MAEIIPAILTDNIEKFQQQLQSIENDTEWVQIDIMDGKFVPTNSIAISQLQYLQTPAKLEVHLMVKNPEQYINDCTNTNIQRFIFHIEATTDPKAVIDELQAQQIPQVGIANNPETPINTITEFYKDIDLILLLAVIPGKQGQSFIKETLKKISEAKKMFPNTLIAVDGGIKEKNVQSVIAAGADICCIGSAITNEDHPGERLKIFQNFAKQATKD